MNNPQAFDCKEVCPGCPLRGELNVNEVEVVSDWARGNSQYLDDGQTRVGPFSPRYDLAAEVKTCESPKNGLLMRICGVGLDKELKFRTPKDLSKEVVANVSSPSEIYRNLHKILYGQEAEFAYTPNRYVEPAWVIPGFIHTPSYGEPDFSTNATSSGFCYHTTLQIVGTKRPMPGIHNPKLRRKMVSIESVSGHISPDTYRINFAYTGRSYTFKSKVDGPQRFGFLTPTQEKTLIAQGIFEYVNADDKTLQKAIKLEASIQEKIRIKSGRNYAGPVSALDFIGDFDDFPDDKPKRQPPRTPVQRLLDRAAGRPDREDDDGWDDGDWDYP